MRKVTIGILAVLAAAALSSIGAHQSSGQAGQEAHSVQSSGKKSETVTLEHYDYMKGAWGSKKTILLKGHVKFVHGDTILTSDEVQYDQETGIAVSPGPLHITDPECDISGDHGKAYFKKKLAEIEGNVTMKLKPKPGEPEPRDKDSLRNKLNEPTTVTCPKIEYLYKDKIATGLGGVVFKQTKRTASADKVVFDQHSELLVFDGNAKGTDENEQTFAAPKVTISIKKGDEWMEAHGGTASFKVNLEEEDSAGSTKSAKPSPASGKQATP